MNILCRKEFVLGAILLLTIVYCAGQTTDENDLNLSTLPDQVAKIPNVGPILKDMLNYVGESLMVINQLLNGVISRMLGGSLPCEMGPKNITCSGTSKEGGVFGIVEALLDQVVLPESVKKTVVELIKTTFNPVIDMIFGGLPLAKKKT